MQLGRRLPVDVLLGDAEVSGLHCEVTARVTAINPIIPVVTDQPRRAR